MKVKENMESRQMFGEASSQTKEKNKEFETTQEHPGDEGSKKDTDISTQDETRPISTQKDDKQSSIKADKDYFLFSPSESEDLRNNDQDKAHDDSDENDDHNEKNHTNKVD